MQLEDGRVYFRRDGRIAGPMRWRPENRDFPWWDTANGFPYPHDGQYFGKPVGEEWEADIVRESLRSAHRAPDKGVRMRDGDPWYIELAGVGSFIFLTVAYVWASTYAHELNKCRANPAVVGCKEMLESWQGRP